jgi:hypothetical protein
LPQRFEPPPLDLRVYYPSFVGRNVGADVVDFTKVSGVFAVRQGDAATMR